MVLSSTIQCAYCGTEYEVSKYKALPHTVAVILAFVFVIAWVTDRLNGGVFLILSGIWLVFDLIWERTVPLRAVQGKGNSAPHLGKESGDAPEQRHG